MLFGQQGNPGEHLMQFILIERQILRDCQAGYICMIGNILQDLRQLFHGHAAAAASVSD